MPVPDYKVTIGVILRNPVGNSTFVVTQVRGPSRYNGVIPISQARDDLGDIILGESGYGKNGYDLNVYLDLYGARWSGGSTYFNARFSDNTNPTVLLGCELK